MRPDSAGESKSVCVFRLADLFSYLILSVRIITGEGIIRKGQNNLVDDFATTWSPGQVGTIHLPSLFLH